MGWWRCCCRRKEFSARTVWIGREASGLQQKFPANVIRNQKYSVLTFVPLVSDGADCR
jgi:phospholipid-translocating ATPase